MKYYRVVVDVHFDDGHREQKILAIEAGNKRLASLRAMSELAKQGYADCYKTLISVEEK